MEERRRVADPDWGWEGGAGRTARGTESFALMQRTSRNELGREEVCGYTWGNNVRGRNSKFNASGNKIEQVQGFQHNMAEATEDASLISFLNLTKLLETHWQASLSHMLPLEK